jgi:hypothetical protein
MRTVGNAATISAGLLGPAVASYTAVLVANTAVPAWHTGHRELPFVFAGSAASAAAGLALMTAPADEIGPAQRVAVAATIVEQAALQRLKDNAGEVAETFEHGQAGKLLDVASRLSAVGAAGALFARRSRIAGAISGACLLAASACTRFGIFAAGRASVADPKYVVKAQR